MHIHILGICGTFMGGLAALAREAGHTVTGCDANVYPPMSDQLRALGISPTVHEFPDHHRYTPRDLEFPGATAILMTEKDAVKCAGFADTRCWYLPVRARIDPALIARVERTIRGRQAA